MTDQRNLLIRYGEISLKGKNRPDFEKTLARNLKQVLKPFDHGPVERPRGRIVVRGIDRPHAALENVCRIPGVSSASVALQTEPDLEKIEAGAIELMGETLEVKPGNDSFTFKVETTRSYKGFPLESMELSAHLGGRLIERFPRLQARMKNPELLLKVEVRTREVLLSTAHAPGPGGLPVGSTGKVMVLLSGGIDSPVAAYLCMKRGARALFINFDAYPFIPGASLGKIKELVRVLGAIQGPTQLFVVPFADIQVAIKKNCPEALRTVLYRRMMMRLAEKAALESGALALVTGESLGQVASQTLENIRCIGAPPSLPVLRPLIGFDKTETMDLARRIDTYAVSIQPHPDCCTVFQPRNPRIRTGLEEAETAESMLDTDKLVETAFSRTDRIRIDP
ncbi:MAG: tRNA 4-thiouridine(8) synthase ThiI [Planctomycetes bacterium]|nr:tRNA 4-thiouridine(8) synthase ThiI [Planctomycetota bacterium]